MDTTSQTEDNEVGEQQTEITKEDNLKEKAENNNESNEKAINDNNENNNEDNNEDNNKDNNKDNNNEENDEQNDESEENEDIFALMYGNDDDFDNDSEDEDNVNVNFVLNTRLIDTNDNQNKRTSDSISLSSKRRSDESDYSQNKRIKCEPTTKIEETSKRLTTSIEVAVDEEPPPPAIPTNSYEFMSYLLELNANDIEVNDMNNFQMSRNLQDLSQCLRFTDFDDFRNAFIPYIITDLWRKLNYHYKQKHTNGVNVMSLKYFLSILTKFKSNRMKNGLEMKCISVVRPKEGPVFQFGQLITIQTAVKPKPNSTTHIITKKKYFGYITDHSVRRTNVENQSEVNHLRLLNESKRDSVIVEEITFMTKYSDELYMRNDALIVAEPIACIHNFYLEARTVFKLNDFPIFKQIFNPIFTSKPSGFTVNVREGKFKPSQIEIIQIGLDVVANSSLSNSSFYVINGPNESKTPLLMEIIRQIVLCKELGTKVLFTSSDCNTLQNMNQILKSRKIKTYFVESDIEKSVKEFAMKHIEHKLSKDMEPQQIQLYQHCYHYFESGQQLSADCLLLKNTILDQLRAQMMNSCSVIVGKIDDLCNDILFYKFFTQPNGCLTCCIIDDSTAISEPQLFSLLWFGITKFLLGGHISKGKEGSTDLCSAYGLSRSFFHRYYSLYLQSDHNNKSTVFDV